MIIAVLMQPDNATNIERRPCALCRRHQPMPRRLHIPNDVDPTDLAIKVARYPANVASGETLARLLHPSYLPGTFILAERKGNPEFLDPHEPDLATFIREMVIDDLRLLSDVGILSSPSGLTKERAAEVVLAGLEAPLADGQSLNAMITNQEVTDTVWCFLKLLIFGNLQEPLHTHERQVSIGHNVALQMLTDAPAMDLHTIAKRSVMSGLIGTNVKETTKLVGPSRVLGRTPFPLDFETEIAQQAKQIQRLFADRADRGLALDCWDCYQREVLERPGPARLVFCTDDYVETLFDLYFVQAQMLAKPDLHVTILPRNGRYGNDACHCDVCALLDHHLFRKLKGAREEGRLAVCAEGPVMGGINGRKLSPVAASILTQADVVVVKGARAYEMLQGLKKPTYFAFNIVRSYTESITGIDAENAQGAFVRQAPGAPSFSGFRLRARRKMTTDAGREVMLAEMTAAEYIDALASNQFARKIAVHGGDEELAIGDLLQRASSLGGTFSEAVTEPDDH